MYTDNLSRSLYITTLLGIVLAVTVITVLFYIPFSSIETARVNQRFSADVEKRAVIADFTIERYIDAVDSLTSRSAIKQYLYEYVTDDRDFQSVVDFTKPRYADGARVVKGLTGARRTLTEGTVITAFGQQDLLENIPPGITEQVFQIDSSLIIVIQRPIVESGITLGYDMASFNANSIYENLPEGFVSLSLSHPEQLVDDPCMYHAELNSIPFYISGCLDTQVLSDVRTALLSRIILYIGLSAVTIVLLLYLTVFKFMKMLNKRLSAAKEEADTANQAKSRFLSAMSHEMRTPLNAVIGFTDLLANTSLTDEQQEYLRSTHASGVSLLRIVDSILDFARLEKGAGEVHLEPVDVEGLIRNAVDPMQWKASQKGVELRCQLSESLPSCVKADQRALRQIILILLDNAVRFTDSGWVELTLDCASRISQDQTNAIRLRLTVRDTGIGLSSEQQKYLFRPFWQADFSLRRERGGVGLGLPIAKQLARVIGGQLEVESELGRGSCFILQLDCETCDVAQPAVGQALPDENTIPDDSMGGGAVLIVEDDLVNMRLTERLIQMALPGLEIRKAENGQQALELLYASDAAIVDCVLMDVQMPVMDGLQAARRIRQHELDSGRHLPVIALTAGTLEEHRRDCFEAGMDEFLPKPIHVDRLIAVLKRYIKA